MLLEKFAERDVVYKISSKKKSIDFIDALKFGCGGRIWTDGLRVMSPTSYQAAPPRVWRRALYAVQKILQALNKIKMLDC